jgi:diguanylate cyclase (GGDEF)-like protein
MNLRMSRRESRRSTRPHAPQQRRRRFGLGSLAGRLVLLFGAPLVVAQVLMIQEIDSRRTTVAQAEALSDDISLMAAVSSLSAPAAIEEMVSRGLDELDHLGLDRSLLAETIGIDYLPWLGQARAGLDAGFDQLVALHGTRVLADGRTVGEHVDEVRIEVGARRAELDTLTSSTDTIDAAMHHVADLIDTLATSARPLEAVESNGLLVDLTEDSSMLLQVLRAVATESRVTAAVLGATTGEVNTDDALLAAGASEYALTAFGNHLLDPEWMAGWAALTDSPEVQAYEELRPTLRSVLGARDATRTDSVQPLIVENPDFVRTIADVLQTSFGRLQVYGGFAATFFDGALHRADVYGYDAGLQVQAFTVLFLTVTVVGLAFLAITLLTTVRPINRLTRRAMLLGRGEVDPAPLPLVGPSDVRAVTATFNQVTDVLASFDHQLRRMSSGDAFDADDQVSLPGELGASLRAQVNHLTSMNRRLRASESLARSIVDTAADAIWTLDIHGRILSVNEAGAQMLLISADDQYGHQLSGLFGVNAPVASLQGELEFERTDGARLHVLVSHSVVPADPFPLHAVFVRDISERKRFEQQLAHQARHDALTGLPNRLAALEHLERAIRRHTQYVGGEERHVAVLFIDLDGFKSINDSRGHAAGDLVLREVGHRLRTTLRNSEFVARLGGDEFLAVVEDIPRTAAEAMAERIIIELSQPFQSDDELFAVSASVGVAIADRPGVDGLELVREADVAVYHAKARGRARAVLFDESLQAEVEANAAIEVALRQGIADGELELHYQPVLDLATSTVWGVEALVRWNRRGHGQVPPDRFIPVAERSTLIIDLEKWVLHDACRTLARWQADPALRHQHMAVNVSGRHLVEGDLLATVTEVLEITGADPRGLEIEITETHLLADFERANEILTVLRRRGISVAVDDFGTGYSSMGYLRQLEIDTLKIDRMFIARVTDAGYDRTIVEVLVQLGRTLGLDIVAEGVETRDQLAFLQGSGCGRAQGYLVAKPMPIDALTRWFRDRAVEVDAVEVPAAAGGRRR